jgi:hypothetical protein
VLEQATGTQSIIATCGLIRLSRLFLTSLAALQVLAAAARLRLCSTLDAAALELLTAMEAECPLAIEALCLLRVATVGLQEPELIDILGGSPTPLPQSEHRRPPLLHDVALQSTLQVQAAAGGGAQQNSVVAAATTKSYRQALTAAINNLAVAQYNMAAAQGRKGAASQAIASAAASFSAFGGPQDPSSNGDGTQQQQQGDGGGAPTVAVAGTAAPTVGRGKVPPPPPSHLLPPALATAPKSSVPFEHRSWSAARRLLLASCVVRARGLWSIDSTAVRSAIDRWLLPSLAQRCVYVQVRSGGLHSLYCRKLELLLTIDTVRLSFGRVAHRRPFLARTARPP